MPLVAVAVCPHPPLLVPEVAAGAAAETADLRAACDAAVTALIGSGARSLQVVGAAGHTAEFTRPFVGSLAPWGAPVEVLLQPPAGGWTTNRLPLSLLIGAWLLSRAVNCPPVRMTGVDAAASPADCRAIGARLGADEPWALLVMGDGSACRGLKSPGYDDPRAQPYDEAVARALAGADPGALLALDPTRSAELRVAGRAPWQVLAGAAQAAGPGWRGALTYDAAPYGVGYFVATWTRR